MKPFSTIRPFSMTKTWFAVHDRFQFVCYDQDGRIFEVFPQRVKYQFFSLGDRLGQSPSSRQITFRWRRKEDSSQAKELSLATAKTRSVASDFMIKDWE